MVLWRTECEKTCVKDIDEKEESRKKSRKRKDVGNERSIESDVKS